MRCTLWHTRSHRTLHYATPSHLVSLLFVGQLYPILLRSARLFRESIITGTPPQSYVYYQYASTLCALRLVTFAQESAIKTDSVELNYFQ